jgi:hypothetical protein
MLTACGVGEMAEMMDVPDRDGRPDPAAARTPAEFVEALRRLKRWAGLGYRQLEKRGTAAGVALPRSTVTAALARDSLPREDLVAALVQACGGDAEDVTRWVTARRRIAATDPAATDPTASDPVDTPDDASATPGLRAAWLALVPPAIGRASWPVRVLAATLVTLVAVVVTAAVVSTVRELTGPGPDQATSTDDDAARGSTSAPSVRASSPPPLATTSAAAPAGGSGWVQIRQGANVTLVDFQAIDLDTGGTGEYDITSGGAGNRPGLDIGLSHGATRLSAVRHPAKLAILDRRGAATVDRCISATGWTFTIVNLPDAVAIGTDICVTTDTYAAAMITVDRPPNAVETTLTFHYTVWARR